MTPVDPNVEEMPYAIAIAGAALGAALLFKGGGGAGGQFVPAHGFSVHSAGIPQNGIVPYSFSWIPASAGQVYLDISSTYYFAAGTYVGLNSGGQPNQGGGIVVTGLSQQTVNLVAGMIYNVRVMTSFNGQFYPDPTLVDGQGNHQAVLNT